MSRVGSTIIDKYFGISDSGSRVAIEVRAGATTFLTMAYILFVNPQILSEAVHVPNAFAQLLTATALAAAFGSILMGIAGRLPFGLAPGMGLNAYFTYSVVMGVGLPWQTALGAVFLSGLVFLGLSAGGVRRAIVGAIPRDLQLATTIGIGMFLAFIGLKNAGIVVDHPATLVTLGDLTAAGPLLATVGLILTAVLVVKRTPGAVLIGLGITTILAMVSGAAVFGNGEPFAGFADGIVAAPVWPVDVAGQLDIGAALSLGLLDIVFVFLFVDLFDTAGTLMGLGHKAKLIDDDGQFPQASRAFACDAAATAFGAVVGTSTTTSYIESAAGIEDGGKTGLTAVVVGLLFALSIVFWPLAAAVPAVATAPVLIIVGAMMLASAADIDWSNASSLLPVFVTVLTMPLTFSIANGISFGIITWVGVKASTNERDTIPPILWLLALLLIARQIFLAE